jgi:hypothetical protein
MIQRNWQHLMNKTHDEDKQSTTQYDLAKNSIQLGRGCFVKTNVGNEINF